MDDEKQSVKNQTSPIGVGLQPARSHPRPDGIGGSRGGMRPGAGRPKGVPNRVTQTFRDVLLQAVSGVGSSREVGKDGGDGLLAYLKVAAVNQENTTLLLLGRILPLKITTEVKHVKDRLSLEEAAAELKACGLEPLLALYLQRYPIGPDEEDIAWTEGIGIDRDPPIDVTPEKDVTPESDTGK